MEKIKISEDLCNYIEALHYETTAMQELLIRMKSNPDEELNEFWTDKYLEKFTEYNVAKKELENTCIIPQFGKTAKWNLNFDTGEIEVVI